MTLPASGAIYASQIQTEFGGVNPIYMSEYYSGGSYVPAGSSPIPASGAIYFSNYWGKTKGLVYNMVAGYDGSMGQWWGYYQGAIGSLSPTAYKTFTIVTAYNTVINSAWHWVINISHPAGGAAHPKSLFTSVSRNGLTFQSAAATYFVDSIYATAWGWAIPGNTNDIVSGNAYTVLVVE